ncbi:MAG: hypothetical protein ACRD4Y_02555, partial [Candidatus Acidiferrales bacterium]
MASSDHNRGILSPPLFMVLSVLICAHPWFLSSAFAQDGPEQELAVNLVEGRAVICAAKDGIILATIDTHGEQGSPPPRVMMLGPQRAGVILGAVEWVKPESKDEPIRLDAELPRLIASATNTAGQQASPNSASDIESIGIAVLERVRTLAEVFHHKIDLPEDEPLIRVVLAGYVQDYG